MCPARFMAKSQHLRSSHLPTFLVYFKSLVSCPTWGRGVRKHLNARVWVASLLVSQSLFNQGERVFKRTSVHKAGGPQKDQKLNACFGWHFFFRESKNIQFVFSATRRSRSDVGHFTGSVQKHRHRRNVTNHHFFYYSYFSNFYHLITLHH